MEIREIEKIIDEAYKTHEVLKSPNRKNIDIMYQPIVEITDDRLLIAPVLFMGSRPERNLLAVISVV